jgi:hypothetical protein
MSIPDWSASSGHAVGRATDVEQQAGGGRAAAPRHEGGDAVLGQQAHDRPPALDL